MSADESQPFRILHISDLHFSSGRSLHATSHSHSLKLLKGVQACATQLGYNHVIVTGDITDSGDEESLLAARQWLLRTAEIGGGQTTGLDLAVNNTPWDVIPGNHDAFNATHAGSVLERFQVSLTNFLSAFPEAKRSSATSASYYRWIVAPSSPIYIVYLPTCHLGDPDTDRHTDVPPPLDRIAQGHVLEDQWEEILNWYDLGIAGRLPIEPNRSGLIPADDFRTSVKILAMHHYLVEPVYFRRDPTMHFIHADLVKPNVALANFDVALCGHKHVSEVQKLSYSDLLGRRGQVKYLLNCLRRKAGLNSTRVGRADQRGRFFPKWFVDFCGWIAGCLRTRQKTIDGTTMSSDALVEQVCDAIQKILDGDTSPRKTLEGLLDECSEASTWEAADREDVKEILKAIGRTLDIKSRREIADAFRLRRREFKTMGDRFFAQAMSGSSGKNHGERDLGRHFRIHDIIRHGHQLLFRSTEYRWVEVMKQFEQHTTTEHKIERRGIFGLEF